MVRPHSGSPRSRQRSFSDGGHSDHRGGRMGPSSREFRSPPGKASPSWREGIGRGNLSYPRNKRSQMEDLRAGPHGNWAPQNQDSDHFRPYPMSQDSQRGRRRSSPSRMNRSFPVQPRHSPHGASGHQRSFHRNQSPHYLQSLPKDRGDPSPHNTFRGLRRFQNPPHEQERNWGTTRQPNPRGRTLGHPAQRGRRWNSTVGYPHPSGVPRPSDLPQRKPREFHERNSYPERWSTERDPRKQYGDTRKGQGRGRSEYHAPKWLHKEGDDPFPCPPYRPPSWKCGPPSAFNLNSRFPPRTQERPMRPMKRRIQEMGRPLPPELEHEQPKRFRREMPVRPMPLRGFGGHGLSLKDKSRLLKGRKFREESVSRFKLPLSRPRPSDKMQRNKMEEAEHMGESSRLPALKKCVKRQSRESPTDTASISGNPEMHSKTQVESRRSVRARSYSSLNRELTRDLVVVSHWEAGTRITSHRSSTSWKNSGTPDHRFEHSAHEHKQGRTVDDQKRKPFRKPGPFQKPGLRHPSVLQKGPDGVFKKPLMATIFSRPPLHQKPVFRKSQSIMSKYRNLQTLRHKVPPPAQSRPATSYRRW